MNTSFKPIALISPKFSLTTLLLAFAFSATTNAQIVPDSISQTMIYQANTLIGEYLDLIKQGNIESARQHWLPTAIERSDRLGITYDGIPIKTDLNSPVMRSAMLNPKITLRGGNVLDSNFARVEIAASVQREQLSFDYYVIKHSGYYWLTFPMDYYTQEWAHKNSRYFRFIINPERSEYFNSIAVESLDNFVDSIGHLLGLTERDMVQLADAKIDYYLCASETQVSQITHINSAGAKGIHDLASDAIVSSTIPHYHEVSHLLTQYRLRNLPLNTLPFMREGLATYLGGRAGLGSAGLLDMATYLFKLEVISLDSMLELMSFHDENNDPSITYAGAALFLKYLVDTYSMDKVLGMYRDLSGDFDTLKGLSTDSIKSIITARTNVSWAEMMQKFEGTYVSGDFRHAETYPRLIPGEAEGLTTKGESVSLESVTLTEADGMVSVVAKKNGHGVVKGSVFFDKLNMDSPRSELFEEQFGESREYNGYRYGIRYDMNEAGLYDYATSTLLAKHLNSMDPSKEYFNASDSTVVFSFPLWISGGVSPLPDAQFIAE